MKTFSAASPRIRSTDDGDDSPAARRSAAFALPMRPTDNGIDALGIQAKRCYTQFRLLTHRTTVLTAVGAILGSASVVIPGIYVYLLHVEDDQARRMEIRSAAMSQSLATHSHAELTQARELIEVRRQVERIDGKIDTMAAEVSARLDRLAQMIGSRPAGARAGRK